MLWPKYVTGKGHLDCLNSDEQATDMSRLALET
jgi:hypothetical protein